MTMTKSAWTAISAVIAAVALVLVALLPMNSAGAAGYTEWVNSGPVVTTHENVAPGVDTDTERWLPVGEPTKHVTVEAVPASYTEWSLWTVVPGQGNLLSEPTPPANTDTHEYQVTGPFVVVDQPAVEGKHYSWNGGRRGVDNPPTVTPPHEDWQLQGVGFDPHLQGNGDPATWHPTDPATSGLHVTGNSPVNASWFYYVPGTPEVSHNEWALNERTRTLIPAVEEVSHLDYKWQKQVRTVITDTPTTPTETPTVTPETPVVTPEVPVVTSTPEVPTETPVAIPQPEEETPEPDKDKDEPVRNIPRDVQVIACVDGVWTTTVNGEVISEAGSCVVTPENSVPQTFSETGL